MTFVEAMFKRLPLVASNIEVLREVLTDNENGLLFNPNEPDALATTMIKLYPHGRIDGGLELCGKTR